MAKKPKSRGKARKSKPGEESVARVTEITATSTVSFERAIQAGISRATKTLDNVRGAWIKEMKVDVDAGEITRYRVDMLVTFVLND